MAIIKLINYKYFFIIRVKCNYWIQYIDVITAFLYNFLNEIIYVEQFYFFVMQLDIVSKLTKVLYRLKQAPHVWYKTLVKFFKRLGFIELEFDHEIFILTNKQLYIIIYIDSLLIFGSDIICLEEIQCNYKIDLR